MKLSEHKINSYTTEVNIDDHKIFLTNKIKKAKVKQNLLSSADVLQLIGYLFGFISFIFLIGIVGHGDYIVEMNLLDNWTINDYVIHIIISISGFCITYLICSISKYLNRIAKNM